MNEASLSVMAELHSVSQFELPMNVAHVSALESQADPLDVQTSSIALCLGPLHPCPYILFCMF